MILSRTRFSILALKLIPIRQVGVGWVSGLICTSICEFPDLDLRKTSHIMGLSWLFLVPRGKHGYSTYNYICFRTFLHIIHYLHFHLTILGCLLV